jgi:hypothetical protein
MGTLHVITVALAALCSAAEETRPFDMGLDAVRPPTGEWFIAGDAAQDADDPKRLEAQPGAGVFLNGSGRTNHLVTQAEYGDVRLTVDFMLPKDSNSGVYLQGRYEIQVFDSYGVPRPAHSDCGGIYQRYDEERGHGFEGHSPRVNASRPAGEWQTFDITFRAPRFDADGNKTQNAAFVRVVHNGQVIHENVELFGPTRAALWFDEKPTGPLMLQGDHGPVAYRNLVIQPLDTE